MMKKLISAFIIVALGAGTLPVYSAQNELNPDTSDWFVYEYPTSAEVAGTPLDVSSLLDAPAGKHGFLTGTEGERFKFEDGTTVRFNGINASLSAPYPDYETATEMAARIAQSGYNIVRFHCVESGYRESIWGRKAEGGRVLKEEIMDRLCFFMSELKKRGVYYLLDMTVSYPPVADMPFREHSNLEDLNSAFKKYSYFNESLIDATKDIAKQLLDYYNPYTWTKIKDDPALALIDLKNEDCISTYVSSKDFGSEVYEAELQAKFNQWLLEKYGSDSALKAAWERKYDPDVVGKTGYSSVSTGKYVTESALLSSESLTNGTVRIYHPDMQNWDEPAYADGREIDRAQFLDQVQREYFADMIDYLRDELDVHCQITGVTGFTPTGRSTQILYSNVDTDFFDSHVYSDLGTSHNYDDGMTMSRAETSIFGDSKYSLLGEVLGYSVYGKPNTVTEWNQAGPNRYRAESMVVMPAFFSMHGKHPFGFTWYCGDFMQQYLEVNTETFHKQSLTFSESPETLAGMPNAARIFLREDVKEADKGYYPFRFIGREAYIFDQRTLDKTAQYDILRDTGLVGKSGMIFDEIYKGDGNDTEVLYHTIKGQKTGKFLTANGEMLTDISADIMKINTEKTQAASGKIGGSKIELSDIVLEISNPFATISYSAVKNKPLYKSKSNLLTVLGDSRNTGMVLSTNDKGYIVIEEAGSAPVLVEPIVGNVTIKTNKNITVYPLTSTGKRKSAKTVTDVAGGKQFTMTAEDKAMHYEIVIDNPISASQLAPVSLGSASMPNLYTDISGHKYKNEIGNVMLYTGVWTAEGSAFKPDEQVTKRDFCKWLIRAMRLTQSDRGISQTDLSANDLGSSADGYTEVSIAYTLGAVDVETSGSFLWKKTYVNPDAKLTRGDAMKIASVILQRSYRDKKQNSDHSAFMAENGYVDVVGNTSDALTRGEAARIIYNIMWAK